MDQQDLILVFSTVQSAEDADRMARELVAQSLVACVQIDGPVRSHYRWAGKVECAEEYRLLLKTSRKAWPQLKEKLLQIHPYEEPEILMLEVGEASAGYREWVIEQTT